jgi:hypothetical protein
MLRKRKVCKMENDEKSLNEKKKLRVEDIQRKEMQNV